jgi:hypothetical protein
MEEPWQVDGPRYAVALQDAKDVTLYKDIFESNKLEEAKRKAAEAFEKNKRTVMIFDRKNPLDSHKITVEVKEEPKVKKEPKAKKEPKPEKLTKKTITQDDLFD